MTTYTRSDTELTQIVKESFSYAQVLRKCEIKVAGGNYGVLKNRIKRLNLDISHFTQQGWNKNKKLGTKYPVEYYLKKDCNSIGSNELKKRLIAAKIFEHKCYKCNGTLWNNLPIPIELEHIDGDHNNNELSNLTILCPNCHAQTSTYRGKNQKRAGMVELVYTRDLSPRAERHESSSLSTGTKQKTNLKKYCLDCKKECLGLRCKKCEDKTRIGKNNKIQWPPNAELLDRLSKSNYSRLAKELNISDNAIRKHLKVRGII